LSEPSEGERNPFAEIIDLFREAADKDTAPAADASGDAAAQVAPRTPAARGGSVEASRAVL
jgi:hypothetical protein